MAKEPSSIKKEIKLPEAKDYAFLKKKGIEIAQELSGDIWTDYNHHDPGITILEQLCFAITEMSYKAGIPVEELLYAKRDEPFDSKDNAFFLGERVFPSAPLTILDYRKLLVDHLYPDVKNAWLVPLYSGAFGVNMSGLYRVDLISDSEDKAFNEELCKKAKRTLSSFRNLCEDLESVRILSPLSVSMKIHLEVDPKMLVEGVIAQTLIDLRKTISPPVLFISREALEEKGMSMDEIYSGPDPKFGFIDVESLRNTNANPAWSVVPQIKLLNLIKETKGVLRVAQLDQGVWLNSPEIPAGFHLVERFKGDEEHDGYYLTTRMDRLPRGHRVKKIKNAKRELELTLYPLREEDPIPDGFYPRLDIASMLENRLITVSVEGLQYDYERSAVEKALERLTAVQTDQYQHELKIREHQPRSRRDVKELANYFSLQNSFPEVYGIGKYGLGKSRPMEWKTSATQLKGYLFFFEQILADYLAQLTNFYKLFSIADQVDTTYFHQIPMVPNRDTLLRTNQDESDLQKAVDEIGRVFDPVTDRRNRALDHLLARFGEEFLAEAYHTIMRNAVEENQEKYEHELIKAKLRFLRNVVELGRDRGKGLDYLDYKGGQNPQDFVTHSSSLQKRLALLFNMRDHQHLSLAESVRETDGFALGKKKIKADEKKAGFTFTAKQQDVLAAVLKEGLVRENFIVKESTKKEGEFQVFFSGISGKGAADPILTIGSREHAEAAVTGLIRKLREMNAVSEGFHLLEHVLLRAVGSTMHTYYVVQEGRIYLESPVVQDEEYEYLFKEALMLRGDDPDNYIITGNKEEGYTLVLTAEDGSIIAYKEGYVDENSAEKERNTIMYMIPNIGDNEDVGLTIRRERHIPKGALLADDFYSLQLSVVLPAWPVRFRNDKFRNLFQQVLKLNVPAHTEVECYWIDLAEMSDFEKVYLEWRSEKAKATPKQPLLDELSWCLVILLKFFRDPHDPLVLKELPALRDKHALSMRFGNEGA